MLCDTSTLRGFTKIIPQLQLNVKFAAPAETCQGVDGASLTGSSF